MTRSTAIRILSFAVVLGLLGQGLLVGNLFGLNLLLLALALLGAAVAMRPAGSRLDPADRWLPIAAVAVIAGLAVRADPLLDLVDVGVGCVVLGAAIAAIGGNAVTRRSILGVIVLGTAALGWVGTGILWVTAATRRDADADADADVRPERGRIPDWLVPIARGLLLALPVLVVFVALFSSADAVFATLTARLFDWQVDLGELPLRAAVAFLVAWVVVGLLGIAAGGLRDWLEPGDDAEAAIVRPQSLGAAAAIDPLRRDGLPILGSIEAATILVAVDVLFAIFVVLQLAYLFGGLDTLAATGLPYAQYARSGFFELVIVAVLAGGLLALVHAVAVRRTAALVGAGLGLAALTAVILASALLRLRIYQDAYGWTELRFYVLATIVWLALGIAVAAVLLIRDRMAWLLHGLVIAAIAVLVGINVVGPSRMIATENVGRLLDPSRVPPDGRTGLDAGYVRVLGDDAVPALISALPALPPADRTQLLADLQARREALAAADATGWPAWNLGRALARDALRGLPTADPPARTLGGCDCPSIRRWSRCSRRRPTACPKATAGSMSPSGTGSERSCSATATRS
jgi:Domain of unknown function (DUF4173)